MILALTTAASRDLANEFVGGKVRKEYVAKVRGKFPEQVVILKEADGREEITADQPLLTVDRQMGLVIVTPEGKVCPSICMT